MQSNSDNPLVNIEVSLECAIKEILPDGEEIYVKPPTFAEQITLQSIKMLNQNMKEKHQDISHTAKLSQIRENLKLAYQEVVVLRDLLNIVCSEDNKYISVQKNDMNAPIFCPRTNINLDFTCRKFALGKAHQIICGGVEKLERRVRTEGEIVSGERTSFEHNCEIFKLRASWYLTKSRSGIIGELDPNPDDKVFSNVRGEETTFNLNYGENGCLVVSLPSELRYISSIDFSLTESSFLTINLVREPSLNDTPPSIALPNAQNFIILQKMFKIFCLEASSMESATKVGDQISLEINNFFISRDPLLFQTLEYIVYYVYITQISKNSRKNSKEQKNEDFLLPRIIFYTKNCLLRHGLLDCTRELKLADGVTVTHFQEPYSSFHCIRMQIVMTLTNIQFQNKFFVEIYEGKMRFITSRNKIIKGLNNSSQIEHFIRQESLLFKSDVLSLIGRKFGFIEHPCAVLREWADEIQSNDQHVYIFNRRALWVVFVLGSIENVKVFSLLNWSFNENVFPVPVNVEYGFNDDFLSKIENAFYFED